MFDECSYLLPLTGNNIVQGFEFFQKFLLAKENKFL